MPAVASVTVSAAARDAWRALIASTGSVGSSGSHAPPPIASSASEHPSSQPAMCAMRTIGVQPSGVTLGSCHRSSGIFAKTASNAAAPAASSLSSRCRSGICGLLLARGLRRIRIRLVLEHAAADRDVVPGPRPLRCQRSVDAFLLESCLQARDLLVVVEVGLHHPALDLRALDLPDRASPGHDAPGTA